MACPLDGGALRWDRAADRLLDGHHEYPIRRGIPFLFAPRPAAGSDKRDVTEIVKEFYEETPFPNYDGLDTRDSLRQKASAGILGKLLDENCRTTARFSRPAAAPAR